MTAVDAGASEAQLVEDCRAGKPGAVLELFRVHWEPTLAFATTLCGSPHDAEDIAATAFLKSLKAMRGGKGPTGPIRPYLCRAVRTAAADHFRTPEHPSAGVVEAADRHLRQGLPGASEAHDHVAEAFASLPVRWQRTLWFIEIKGLKPRQAAPLLGITPNAVSALLRRARKGLQQAYLVVLQQHSREGSCDSMEGLLLAQLALGEAAVRDRERVETHIEACPQCRRVFHGLCRVGSRMAAGLGPGPWLILISPVTAVRILDLVTSGAPGAFMRITDSMVEPGHGVRLAVQLVRPIVAAGVALGLIGWPGTHASSNDFKSGGQYVVCQAHGSFGCHQDP